MRYALLALAIAVLTIVSPALTLAGDSPADFANLINHFGVASATQDWSVFPFSDQGSWQGYATPRKKNKEQRGGFSGPFLMAEGLWLSPQLVRFGLVDGGTAEAIPWTDGKRYISRALPGRLQQQGRKNDLRVELDLWFATAQTALIRARVHNEGKVDRSIRTVWSGSVFPSTGTLVKTGADLEVHSTGGSVVRVATDFKGPQLVLDSDGYRLTADELLRLPAGGSVDVVLALTWTLAGDTQPERKAIATLLADHDRSSAANEARWQAYLAAVAPHRAETDPLRILAIKSLQTLVNNWRSPAGRMRYSALFPSSNISYFNGFWAWDSWKHAVGLALFDTELAADQIRAMFDHQNAAGMIADVVYLDPTEDNWRDTKPPLAGWAIRAVYEAGADLEFVRELYPRLVAYHEFWYRDRDHDRDGLCEYGSTDGTLIAARWESGMDNAVRFDRTKMLQNSATAWSMDQESVDLNCYLYLEKRALHDLASALGRRDEASRWARSADQLREQIRTSMYDVATGWYYDINVASGAIVPVQGPEGWIPLWTGVATDVQAGHLRETMLDPAKFRTHVPFPTVARDDPEFSDGYWRGLVWLDQAYFAIEGLRRYGNGVEADELSRQLFENLAGATKPRVPLRENYDPLSGKGRNVKHFSWTAAHLLLLVDALR